MVIFSKRIAAAVFTGENGFLFLFFLHFSNDDASHAWNVDSGGQKGFSTFTPEPKPVKSGHG